MFGHADGQQQTDNQYAQGQVTPDPTLTNDQSYSDNNLTNNSAATVSGSFLNDIPASSPAPVNDNGGLSLPSTPFAPAASAAADDDHIAPSAPTTDTGALKNDGESEADNTELLDIKQKALQQLSPLVSHLDQTPEDKFKTTMMLIQASDDQALLPDAYKAAQEITNEKAKAQALLDVVNEINYFTQPQ